MVVAEFDGAIAGVVVLTITDEGFLLENVAVDPKFQGKGVGRTLLTLAESKARASGYRSIYVYINEMMTENQSLYAKVGYVEYGRRINGGYARIFMRKQLS